MTAIQGEKRRAWVCSYKCTNIAIHTQRLLSSQRPGYVFSLFILCTASVVCLQLLRWEDVKTSKQIFRPLKTCTLTICHYSKTKQHILTFALWYTSYSASLMDWTHTNTHTHVCLKGFLWLDLRHSTTTHAWNHLCRHTSINQHRKDVWHHKTTRFTTQAKSSKCFHTELWVFYMSDYAACDSELPGCHVQDGRFFLF